MSRSARLATVVRIVAIVTLLALGAYALTRMGIAPRNTGRSPGVRPPTSPALVWVLASMAVLSELRPLPLPGRSRSAAVYVSLGFSFAILLVSGVVPAIAVQIVATAAACLIMRTSLVEAALTVARFVAALVAADFVLRST